MSFARRIVIDTGVMVSAAIRPQSIPSLALEKALLHFDVCASRETFSELAAVLLRRKFDRYLSKARRQEYLKGLRQHLLVIDVEIEVSDCADAKHNKFLALAEAAQAELILSSDTHLTAMFPWRGIPIMPPAPFLIGIR